jgi:hypothetical protein
MSRLKQLFIWIARAWPLHFLLLAVGVHVLALTATHLDQTKVNRIVSLVLQLAGGGLVLYSIDSNIGVLRKRSLLAELGQYLRECPLVRRSVTLQVQGSSHVVTSARARLTAKRNPSSIDEKIAYLQEQLDVFRNEHREDMTELRGDLDKKTKDLGGRLDSLSQTARDIESKFDQVAVGDVRFQVLGVIFIVYGAIAGYAP